MKPNYLGAALRIVADQMRAPWLGLSEERRLDIATACLLAADELPDHTVDSLPEGPARDELFARQFFAREILGAIYCPTPTNGPEPMPEEQQVNLVAFLAWLATATDEKPQTSAASDAQEGDHVDEG